MGQLNLSNIVTVSVSQSQLGANEYNTSNLGLFTDEVPANSFGTAAFKAYVDPTAVSTDFGTNSKTYAMALSVFSQQPNILAGGGQLIVILMGVSAQSWSFSGVAASGTVIANWNGSVSAAINWNDTAAQIQAKLQAMPGLGEVTVTGSISGSSLVILMSGVYGASPAAFTFTSNTLLTAGSSAVTITNAIVTTAAQAWALSGVAASGTFVANYNGLASTAINWNDNAAAIQTKLQAISGLSSVTVGGSISSQALTITMTGASGIPQIPFTFTSNSLQTAGSAAVTITNSITASVGETLGAAITRTSSLVQYFGIIVTETVDGVGLGSSSLLAAASVIQSLNKIGFFVGDSSADIAPAGALDQLRSGSFTQSRGLYYGDSSSVNGFAGLNAMTMSAAYAGFGLQVNFSGSNTTITMNLKTLNGIQPDPSMSQTIYNAAQLAGADIYASNQGVPKTISFGSNLFYDSVYNLQWFVGAIQVAGFNYLATTGTKVPQTQAGLNGLAGAYRAVCQQAVTNGYVAPGAWTSATSFGTALVTNIAQYGFYVYANPIALQSQAQRVTRVAPLIQIGIKEAGAIQSSSVIVYVNP